MNVEVRDNKVAVNHKYIGWSRDNNRNLTGKLITVYSSETTALILDGVKEGGVPNVNLYTFDVYKSIVVLDQIIEQLFCLLISLLLQLVLK